MRAIIFIAALAVTVAVVLSEYTDEEKRTFRDWCKRHNKKYRSHEEEKKAMKNVIESKRQIDEHNELHKQGKKSYRQAIWEHSDLSFEEKRKLLTGLKKPEGEDDRSKRFVLGYPNYPPGPDAIDWTEKGLVGPVQNQGGCGSCYSFSASEIVNSLIRKRGDGKELTSPQQLVDCSKNNPGGCGGGWPQMSLQYIKQNGITDESQYPYVAYERPCEYNRQTMAVIPPNYIDKIYSIPTRGNETMMKDIVGNVGPVSIALCDDQAFQNYQGGVFIEENCCTELTHAPIITGYGRDPTWGDYWIIKNSWGTSWGENGYMRLARNRNNMCNVAFYAVYAT